MSTAAPIQRHVDGPHTHEPAGDVNLADRGIRSARAMLALAIDRPATSGALRGIAIALNRFGLTNRDQCLGACSVLVGRPIASRKELTALEASRVLDHLDELARLERR